MSEKIHEALFSKRILTIPPSGTIALADRVRELKRAGTDVLDFTTGEPDFDTPTAIKEAAVKALMDGHTKYSASAGLLELRKLIAQKLKIENGIEVEAGNIIVTPGAKQALVYAFMSLLNDGDEVLIPEPCWVSYSAIVLLAGGIPVPVPGNADDGYIISAEELERKCTPRTKLLIFANPNNPTGTLLSRRKLEAIAEVAERRNLIVIADEIYEKIIFDGAPYISFATIPGMRERTITINGFSKTFAMTGWRLGYAAAPLPIIEKMLILQQQMATCPSTFAQYGGIYAYSHPIPEVKDMIDAYEKRRNMFVESLTNIQPFTCLKPSGAFYLWLNVKGFHKSSITVAKELLDEVHLAVVPGTSFGDSGEGYLRLSFATSEKNLREAVKRFRTYAERNS